MLLETVVSAGLGGLQAREGAVDMMALSDIGLAPPGKPRRNRGQ